MTIIDDKDDWNRCKEMQQFEIQTEMTILKTVLVFYSINWYWIIILKMQATSQLASG